MACRVANSNFDSWATNKLFHVAPGQPELDRLIRLRMPYVEPLNHVQIELIRRRRSGDDTPEVREGIHLAINGVAAGLRNSG